MAFLNLAQETAEDCTAVTNLTTENSTLSDQVALYANHLSTKEEENGALQTVIKTYRGGGKKPQGRSSHPKEVRPLWRRQNHRKQEGKNINKMENRRTGPPTLLVEHSILLEPWGGRPLRNGMQEQEARPQIRGNHNNKVGRENLWTSKGTLMVRLN